MNSKLFRQVQASFDIPHDQQLPSMESLEWHAKMTNPQSNAKIQKIHNAAVELLPKMEAALAFALEIGEVERAVFLKEQVDKLMAIRSETEILLEAMEVGEKTNACLTNLHLGQKTVGRR